MKLKIAKIVCRDLEDKGGFMDKQDPSVHIRVGIQSTFRTERQKDAGTSAKFPEEFLIELSDKEANGDVEFEVFNEGRKQTDLTHVGIGAIRIKSEFTQLNVEVAQIYTNHLVQPNDMYLTTAFPSFRPTFSLEKCRSRTGSQRQKRRS